jgi:Protein of unknown function (DUF3533)
MPLSIIRRLYPRAGDPRPPISHPEVRAHRIKFFKAALLNFVLLLLLFLALYCYLFGSLFQQESLTSNLRVLWVDYDAGIIGEAVRDAYQSLQSDNFPTLVEQPQSEFPSESDLRAAVCSTDYWAALYTHPGSSANLGHAVLGSNASQYNRSSVLSYIWNEARYPTVVDSLIASNLQKLSDEARVAYIARNATSIFAQIPPNSLPAISAFANPWTLTSSNIQVTTQGTRTIYNTIAIVLMIIQDFFFLGTINGLYEQFKIYTRIVPERIILFRYGFSLAFTMFGTMLVSGAIWAFKASWNVSGTQYALTWLILWLFSHGNFLSLDVFTLWIPLPYISMTLITWVVINVTSVIYPFELSSPFYRWSYALPAHAAYDALTDVWSHGCSPHLDYALPVLFAYELSGLILSGLGVYKRSHYAVVREGAVKGVAQLRSAIPDSDREHGSREAREAREPSEPRERIDADGELSQKENENSNVVKETSIFKNEGGDNQKEIEDGDPENVETRAQRVETRASSRVNFGPSFRLFGTEDE